MFTQVSSQLDGYLFTAALQSRLFPFMRRCFSAKASLYSISRPSSPSALRWVPMCTYPENTRGQKMAGFSQGSQSLLFSIHFKFHLTKLSGIQTLASLDLEHLTGLRPRQTPMHCPLTQEFSTQVFHTFMIPYAC